VIGVNLVGVVNGIRAFMPGMIASGQPGHVVNTASVAGLTNPAFMGAYNATKHAVVAISETLRADLHTVQAPIGVSVLCPGWVDTQIAYSDRNKPGGPDEESPKELRDVLAGLVAGGMSPDEIARQVFDAIHANRFWIRTHPGMEQAICARAQAVLDSTAPPLMLPTEIV
jgi:NAD(P)-dependent dehydrogenase (short-subunit alcohol dehydrogenase family)